MRSATTRRHNHPAPGRASGIGAPLTPKVGDPDLLRLGWVPDRAGRYHGQLAGNAEPNGPLGLAYLAAIAPFRHLVVYPLAGGPASLRLARPAPAAREPGASGASEPARR